MEGGYIDFGADPIGISWRHVCIGISITIYSCLHSILWTSGWILTEFSGIYNALGHNKELIKSLVALI